MFRCKECQTEYDVKPDYCDCGNDTFDEIVEKPVVAKVEKPVQEKPVQKEEKIEPVKKVEKTEPTKKVEEPKVVQQPKMEEVSQPTQPIVEEREITRTRTVTRERRSDIDTFAWVIFAICVVVSLIIIFFPCKSAPVDSATPQQSETKQSQDIPSISKLWNNALPQNVSTPEPEQKVEETVQEETKIELPTPKKEEAKQKEVKKNNSVKQNTQQQAPKKASSPAKSSTTVAKNNTQTTQQKTVSANPQEIGRYKVRLRNYIASKIDFTRVVGDGSCSFTFRVASNGALIDKKAGYISDNDSLNEVVYNALRQTSSFNAPPQGFNTNAVLKLYVRMQNGAFEVSLN